MCDFSRRGTILETCPYMTISAFQWYPTQINGHKFRGRNADFIHLPDTLLAVPAALTADCANLSRIQLTEFRTEHWFLTNDTTNALNGKVGKYNSTSYLFFFSILIKNSRWQYYSFFIFLILPQLKFRLIFCLYLGIFSQPLQQRVRTPRRWQRGGVSHPHPWSSS